MNSLEFVNEKINWTISNIKDTEEQLLKFKRNKERNFFYIFECNCLNHYKEELEKFKQIKTELEAWYSIKSGLIYEKESKHRMSEEMRSAYTIYLTDDEMESIQKALEVNE